jgi:hypothetical protein
LKLYINDLRKFYIDRFNKADKIKEKIINSQTKTDSARKAYAKLKSSCNNENIEDFVLNNDEQKSFIVFNNRIYQKSDPIYQYPKHNIKAHFYAPAKKVFGKYYDTFNVNIAIIWIFTAFLYITLYYSVLQKTLDFGEYVDWFFRKRKRMPIE